MPSNTNSDEVTAGQRLLSFARRNRGRISFYTVAAVGLWFHSHGASGIGMSLFAIVSLALAQDVDSLTAALKATPPQGDAT